MIPVIFGGVNYADFLPPQMGYIDALNHSPEVIGRTLKYLRSNQTAFDKYMEWRDLYDVDLEEWPCTLCHQLRLQGKVLTFKFFEFPPHRTANHMSVFA